MRFLHISDLHIGKKLFQLSLLEDQRHVLNQIVELARTVDCVLVAGDVFNRAQPAQEALALAGDFFERLSATGVPVAVIAGNHDNAELIGYCAGVLRAGGVYAAGSYAGRLEKLTLHDGFGAVDVHLLPFVRPAHVRPWFPEETIDGYADAVRCALKHAEIDFTRRNVLVAHQYVAGAAVCESEELIVGGVDQIPSSLFEGFDYVALGHLHTPQKVGEPWVRYSGSPLAYSVSEVRGHADKSAMIVEMDAKGDVRLLPCPLTPLHPMREVRGTLAELTAQPYSEDYVQATLTDPVLPMDAMGALRITYPNIVTLRAECMAQGAADLAEIERVEQAQPIDHFVQFYRMQNPGRELTPRHMRVLEQLFAEIGEEGKA